MIATAAEEARGRMEALHRIAESGAAEGWETVPALTAILVRVAAGDRDSADQFLGGWRDAVLDVAGLIVHGQVELADSVRELVLAGEWSA